MADDMDETVVYNLDDEQRSGRATPIRLMSWINRDLEVVSALCLTLLKHNQLKPYRRGRFNTYLSFKSGEDAEKRLDEASFWLQKAAASANSGDGERIELWQAKVKQAQEYFVGLGDEQQPGTYSRLCNEPGHRAGYAGVIATLGFPFDGAVETPGDAAVDPEVSHEQTDAVVEVEEDGSETTEDTTPA
ncbi:hypothetical protein LTR56_010419 [Elasticomyces elasticus]|nr:hypothetical protein LTR56_010419 [Elasticomyces elasticus]KAK3648489.1 hypothetical protein LTR22_013381 [Elasticomyces elasticus]KAK4916798.1 hypothetical protein LTR49_015242 [Elasticomyces elasticus]